MSHPSLVDDRSHPDFRSLYGQYAAQSAQLDAAVHRVRLGGLTLQEPELASLVHIRLLLGEVDALALTSEAEALAADPRRRHRPALWVDLLESRRLQLRLAPLAGWNPDFSVFTPNSDRSPDPPTVMLGPHQFERPYPHPGPAFGVVLHGAPARKAQARFEEMWGRGHDLVGPVRTVLREALDRPTAGRTTS